MTKEFDYQKAMSELRQILADMQNSDIDVDAALQRYERGQALIVQIGEYLKSAENKITIHKAE